MQSNAGKKRWKGRIKCFGKLGVNTGSKMAMLCRKIIFKRVSKREKGLNHSRGIDTVTVVGNDNT